MLRRSERRRSVAVALAAASHDIERNLRWLGYVDWQRRHPEEKPRDHQFGSFDLFPHYAPVLMAEKPELAYKLLAFNAWVQYARGGLISGFALGDDDISEITEIARRLRDGFGFPWAYELLDEYQWAKRDYSIR